MGGEWEGVGGGEVEMWVGGCHFLEVQNFYFLYFFGGDVGGWVSLLGGTNSQKSVYRGVVYYVVGTYSGVVFTYSGVVWYT